MAPLVETGSIVAPINVNVSSKIESRRKEICQEREASPFTENRPCFHKDYIALLE